MRRAIQFIAAVYGLIGAAGALQWLHAVLFAGTDNTSSDLVSAVLLLGLAYGLATFQPWARGLALVISALLGFMGVLSLIVWLGLRAGVFDGASGLIVDRPLLSVLVIAVLLALGYAQWRLLTRPGGRRLFYPEGT
jgi:hypothetical protein